MKQSRRQVMNTFLKQQLQTKRASIIVYRSLQVVLTILLLVVPFIHGKLVDVFVYTKQMPSFYWWMAVLVGAILCQAFVRYGVARIEFMTIERVILHMNQALLRFLLQRPTKWMLSFDAVQLHWRLLQDTAEIIRFHYITVSSFMSRIVLLFIVSVVLYEVNGYLLLALVAFLPIYTAIYVVFRERIFTSSKAVTEAANDCFALRNEWYSHYLDVKVRRHEEAAYERLAAEETRLLTSVKRSFSLHYQMSTLQLGANSIFQLGGYALGGLAVLNGYMTLGVFLYVIQYFVMLLTTVEEFLTIGTTYEKYRAAVERMNEICDMEREHEGEHVLTAVQSLTLHDVNYRHAAQPLYAEGLTATFTAGQLYAIAGGNGVGKSTLLLALAGIYRDQQLSGEIRWNGVRHDDVHLANARRDVMSIMLQRSFTLGLSVGAYVCTFLTEADLAKVAERPELVALIDGDFFTLQSLWHERFDSLSGGEQQVINAFLCLAKEASIYLLDEPTANLFPQLRAILITALQATAARGRIVIVSTHDEELIAVSTRHHLVAS